MASSLSEFDINDRGGFAPNGREFAVARVGENVNSIYVFLLLSPSVCPTGIVTSIVIGRVCFSRVGEYVMLL